MMAMGATMVMRTRRRGMMVVVNVDGSRGWGRCRR
jgi:hypothetical protein